MNDMIYTLQDTIGDMFVEFEEGEHHGMAITEDYEVVAWPWCDAGRHTRYRFLAVLPNRSPDHAFGTVITTCDRPMDEVARTIGTHLAEGGAYEDFHFSRSSTPNSRTFESTQGIDTGPLIRRFLDRLDRGSLMASEEWLTQNRAIPKPAYETIRSMAGIAGQIVRSRPGDTWLLTNDIAPTEDLAAASGRTPAEAFARLIDPDHTPTPASLKAIRMTDLCRFDENYDWQIHSFIRAARTLPPEWLPEVPVSNASEDQLLEWSAAISAMCDIHGYCMATGRTSRSIIGAFRGDWLSYAEAVCEAAGLYYDDSQSFDDVFLSITDMVDSFENQVVLPALHRHGIQLRYDDFDKNTGRHDGPGRFRRRTMAFLLGDRTLPKLAEISAKWHANVTTLAELEAGLSSHDLAWDTGLRVRTLTLRGKTIEIRPLGSLGELSDEGAPGPDANGMLGMDHCIVSYARDVAMSSCHAVLSVRTTGPDAQRLSTAFVEQAGNLRVVEHRGRSNGPPPPVAQEALDKYVRTNRIRDDRVPLKLDHPSLYDPSIPGSVETMLDAWSFAMPKPNRGMDVEDFVGFYLSDHPSEEPRGPSAGP